MHFRSRLQHKSPADLVVGELFVLASFFHTVGVIIDIRGKPGFLALTSPAQEQAPAPAIVNALPDRPVWSLGTDWVIVPDNEIEPDLARDSYEKRGTILRDRSSACLVVSISYVPFRNAGWINIDSCEAVDCPEINGAVSFAGWSLWSPATDVDKPYAKPLVRWPMGAEAAP